MARLGVYFAAVALAVVAAGFYFRESYRPPTKPEPAEVVEGNWLEHLHSQNPKVAEEAARQLKDLGASALPQIRRALQDPAADTATKKAALKAAGMLGTAASPAVADAAALLPDPELTEEAAVALSFLGRDAYAPLRLAASSEDPVVRREAVRSLGKLRERAPLDARAVVPLLLQGLTDTDPRVRTVAATYLGILHDDGPSVVPALIETLQDEDPEVRAAAATALGSFEPQATLALPALRKAAGDRDENVAREAGLSIVKLQSSSRK
ncbi:MAG TPA: HEAT repeat domain-containing protein [Vicinamibacterales bacterium]|nr:HEAT repeat domain-containing protein [Vicinamibacterales bacterium]